MEKKGTFDLARDLRFDVVDFEELAEADWVKFGPGDTHWPEGYFLPRLVVDSEYTVATCCLKTHGAGGVFTMSLKLSVGLTPKSIRRPMLRSPDMRRMIAEPERRVRGPPRRALPAHVTHPDDDEVVRGTTNVFCPPAPAMKYVSRGRFHCAAPLSQKNPPYSPLPRRSGVLTNSPSPPAGCARPATSRPAGTAGRAAPSCARCRSRSR
jgi:hypothetical protein